MPILIEQDLAAGLEPDDVAVSFADSVFTDVLAIGLERMAENVSGLDHIFFEYQVGPFEGLALEHGSRVTGNDFDLIVEKFDRPIGIAFENDIGDVVDQQPVISFALPQGDLRALFFGDVRGNAQKAVERAFGVAQGIDGKGNRKGAAVLVQVCPFPLLLVRMHGEVIK